MNSIFPSAGGVSSSANGLALQVGGGMNLPLSSHIGVRAFEADWLRTALPNSTTNVQNNLRLGVGVFFRLR
jgi:peptidoglycan-associated lipoprotein